MHKCTRAIKITTFILIFLLFFPSNDAHADFHYRSARVFPGTRYLTLSNLRVYEKPDTGSAVIADVLYHRLIYAIPNNKTGWAEIKGTGVREYPDPYTGYKGDKVELYNGKLAIFKERIDRDDYYPMHGYIEIKYLGSMDTAYPIPISRQSLITLPSPWHALGVDERRFVSADDMAYPFSSVALIVTSLGTCSGVLIESDNLVATAGHCFDQSNPGSAQVNFIHEPGPISATVIGTKFYENFSQDWALLRLSHPPTIPRRPVYLPSDGSWMKSGTLDLLTLGFAGDEDIIKRKLFGEELGHVRVHGDICTFAATSIEAMQRNGQITNVYTRTDGAECVNNHGDSGGPILLWNSERPGYELLGITSWGSGESDAKYIPDFLAPDAKQLFSQTLSEVQKLYGVTDLDPNDASIPGIAAVAKGVGKSVGYYNEQSGYYLHSNLVSAILEQTGSTKTADDLFSIFKAKNIGTNLQTFNDGQKFSVFGPDYNFYDEINEVFRTDLMNYRFMFYSSTIPDSLLDQRYQLKLSVGDTLDLSSMQSNKVPYTSLLYAHLIFMLDKGSVDAGYLLMRNSDYKEEQMIAMLKEQNVKQSDIDDFINHMRNKRLVIIGGDAFVVDKRDLKISQIFRNFAGIVKGDIESLNMGRYYNYAAEDPKNDRLLNLKSDVTPTSTLRVGNLGAPTPASIPGGKVVTVRQVWRSILAAHRGQAPAPLIISAIGEKYGVPTSTNLSFAAAGGDFNDATQQKLASTMQQLAPNKTQELIVYCHYTDCWLSYNLSLRLIALGYTRVEWMRDGIKEWILEGLPIAEVSRKYAEN